MDELEIVGRPLPTVESNIAIVGSRAATEYGLQVAYDIARDLALAGFSVTSGGAHGIDGAAQRGALSAAGHTVAVLPCGADVDYPDGHADLLGEIRSRGTVVSAYPNGSAARAKRFLERNGLIVRLCAALVVVEGTWRSGTRNAVRHACEAQVPILAVPGPTTSVTSGLTNQLIVDGTGRAVRSAQDVLNALRSRRWAPA